MIPVCAKSSLKQKILYRDHANPEQYKHGLKTGGSIFRTDRHN